jgi:hypothetical protein
VDPSFPCRVYNMRPYPREAGLLSSFGFLFTQHSSPAGWCAAAMYTVGNINVIAAVAVIGGGLFGFDISSMSAIIGNLSLSSGFAKSSY